MFQHTAARRRLVTDKAFIEAYLLVSTHSRPKAAGRSKKDAEEGLSVSTHSRPKAAGGHFFGVDMIKIVSTHSRPKAAGLWLLSREKQLPVSTHSRPKAAGLFGVDAKRVKPVSTHSRPKAAGRATNTIPALAGFQHTAARRRLVSKRSNRELLLIVSTHSRPKAAGPSTPISMTSQCCFNTQPPEGGWVRYRPFQGRDTVSTHSRPKAAGVFVFQAFDKIMFQHTAARRRLAPVSDVDRTMGSVSTHSRPKAAGQSKLQQPAQKAVSTHSRPKAAGVTNPQNPKATEVSTHSRPKAAGTRPRREIHGRPRFNTQPPEGGWKQFMKKFADEMVFQHTATRRRLAIYDNVRQVKQMVSTHSRPKAAGIKCKIT